VNVAAVRRCLTVLAGAALLAGCQVGAAPAPLPWRGPAPASLAVWPIAVGQGAAPELLVGLDAALRRRGFRVPSLAVGGTMLAEADVAIAPDGAPADLAAAGQVLGVDAIVVLVVERFRVEDDPWRSADWAFTWRLLSTRGHGVLWECHHDGAWQRPRRDEGDAVPRVDDRLEPVTLGRRELEFRSEAELVAWLHRFASQRLPAAGSRS
jgi:hypothetical protein